MTRVTSRFTTVVRCELCDEKFITYSIAPLARSQAAAVGWRRVSGKKFLIDGFILSLKFVDVCPEHEIPAVRPRAITCAYPDCAAQLLGHARVSEIRKEAKLLGWSRALGTDLCPAHVPAAPPRRKRGLAGAPNLYAGRK